MQQQNIITISLLLFPTQQFENRFINQGYTFFSFSIFVKFLIQILFSNSISMENLTQNGSDQANTIPSETWVQQFFTFTDKQQLKLLLVVDFSYLLTMNKSIMIIGQIENIFSRKKYFSDLYLTNDKKKETNNIKKTQDFINQEMRLHFLLLKLTYNGSWKKNMPKFLKNLNSLKGILENYFILYEDYNLVYGLTSSEKQIIKCQNLSNKLSNGKVSHQSILINVISLYLDKFRNKIHYASEHLQKHQWNEIYRQENQYLLKCQENQCIVTQEKKLTFQESLREAEINQECIQVLTKNYRDFFLLQHSKQALIIQSMKGVNEVLNSLKKQIQDFIQGFLLQSFSSQQESSYQKGCKFMKVYHLYNRFCTVKKKMKYLKTKQIKIDQNLQNDNVMHQKIEILFKRFSVPFQIQQIFQSNVDSKLMIGKEQRNDISQAKQDSESPKRSFLVQIDSDDEPFSNITSDIVNQVPLFLNVQAKIDRQNVPKQFIQESESQMQMKQNVLNVKGTLKQMSRMIKMFQNSDKQESD